MLDVKRLRVLREVAARGSFSAAADALAYTQSAVSQQIAALEREAGTRLVDRGARGVRLTDAGEVLLRHTEAILRHLDAAEAELEALAAGDEGRVRLVSFPSAGATLVPAAVAALRRRRPGVEVSLALAEPPELPALLRAGEQDVGLTIAGAPDTEGLELVHLLDDPMYVVLPREHPLARRARIRLTDLAEESWLIGSDEVCPDSRVFEQACELAGVAPRVALRSDDYNAIQGFVAAGVGAALIPDLALVNVRDDIVVRRPAGPPVARRIFAATLAGGPVTPATRLMLDALVGAAAGFRERQPPLAA